MRTLRNAVILFVSFSLFLVGMLAATAHPAGAATAPATCATPDYTTNPPPGSTRIDQTPVKWATTDGDVLASEMLYMADGTYLAIGGGFNSVTQPNGIVVPARNFAIVRVSDGKVAYGGNVNSYVRVIRALWGRVFIGGDFTAVNGSARGKVASFDATSYALQPWNPGYATTGRVYALDTNGSNVYYGGTRGLYSASWNGPLNWTAPTANGSILTMMMSKDGGSLYFGGTFDQLNGASQVHMSKIILPWPVIDTAFNPYFLPNSPTPGAWDGENPANLAWNSNGQLLVGTAGHQQAVRSLDPSSGGQYWGWITEGDTQGMEMVGNSVVTGFHRNHENYASGFCPYTFYATQWNGSDGGIMPFDAHLGNGPGTASGGKGGVQDVSVDAANHILFLVGAFKTYGANCNYVTAYCTGGTPQKFIAAYRYTP